MGDSGMVTGSKIDILNNVLYCNIGCVVAENCIAALVWLAGKLYCNTIIVLQLR